MPEGTIKNIDAEPYNKAIQSAVKMNRQLDEIGGVYNKSVKRSRAFCTDWIEKGMGKMIQNEIGNPQAMFTTLGVSKVTEIFISEGLI